MSRIVWLLSVTVLAACALETPPPDTARIVPPAFGSNGDSDIAAINLSSWAFARAGNTHGDPADAAASLAAVDYLAGQLSTSPRWSGMSPITKSEMLQARVQIRTILGIAPTAHSQSVVEALEQVAFGYAARNQATINAALQNPVFGLPAAELARRLDDLPYLATTNVATQHAAAAAEPGGGACGLCR